MKMQMVSDKSHINLLKYKNSAEKKKDSLIFIDDFPVKKLQYDSS